MGEVQVTHLDRAVVLLHAHNAVVLFTGGQQQQVHLAEPQRLEAALHAIPFLTYLYRVCREVHFDHAHAQKLGQFFVATEQQGCLLLAFLHYFQKRASGPVQSACLACVQKSLLAQIEPFTVFQYADMTVIYIAFCPKPNG